LEFLVYLIVMDDELNYDPLHLSQSLKLSQTGIPKPKVFSLTQSANQRENFVVKSTGNRDRPPFSENPKAFRTGRLLGGDQTAKRSPIFPALQRFQRPQNQPPPQKPQSATPFFSLLKPSTPVPASTPANIFHSHSLPAHSIDSSPHHDHEPSCASELLFLISQFNTMLILSFQPTKICHFRRPRIHLSSKCFRLALPQ
jgi:hypothetical protein